MQPAVETLLQSPTLAIHVQRLTDVLAAEQARRAAFYDTITESDKAEFINGKIVMHSPARKQHTDTSDRLLVLLRTFVRRRALGWVGHEKVLISLTRNDYEPDVCFFRPEKAAALLPKQMQFPAPDFIAEVLSPSTEATDRGLKREDYAAHGVAEYWLLDPDAEVLEQYVLEEGTYTLRMKSASGEVTSVAVPGFGVPVAALFDDDANLEALRDVLR